MVAELILGTLLTQAMSHYGHKGFTWLDAQTKELAEEAASGDDAAREQVVQRLAEKLRAAPPRNTSDGSDDGLAAGGGSEPVDPEQLVKDLVFSV